MSQKLSIRDIARMADVSVATVSRVINNNGRFSEETRQRVQKVIDENGYVTNMAARSLRSSKSGNIGMIVPDISNDFFSAIALHAERFLAGKGYSVFVCNSGNDPEREMDYFRTLTSKLVDGILCISGLNTLEDDLLTSRVPVVCIDRYPENARAIPRVSTNDVEASRVATEHLIEQGCQNILFVSSYTARHSKRDREDGFIQALTAHGLPSPVENRIYITGEQPSMVEAETFLTELLQQRGLDFDGIFCSSDHTAVGCLRALRAANVDVPGQVRVAGFDDSIYAQLTTPSITSIQRHPDQLARRGCEALLQLIAGETPPLETYVPADLVIRDSTLS